MIDDSISPEAAPDPSKDSGVKVYASVASLSIDGTAPEVGDEVDLTVRGTVNSVDGDVACISPTEVNGEPAPAAPGAEAEAPADDTGAQRDMLRGMAAKEDGPSY